MAPDKLKMASGNFKVAPDKSKISPGNLKIAHDKSKMAPGNFKLAPDKSKMAPGNFKMVPGKFKKPKPVEEPIKAAEDIHIRESPEHDFDSPHVTRMTSKIQELDAILAATMLQLDPEEREPDPDFGHHHHDIIEPESVTSCVLKICTRATLEDTDYSESELEVGETDKAERILRAPPNFYRHPFPEGFRFQSLVPRSRADWLNFLVWLVKQRLIIKYLTDEKLKRIIEIARGQIGRLPPYEVDPVIPECYYWDEDQVASWLEEIGYPELQNVFRENYINGRRLAIVDASALNKMGIQNWKIIQEMARHVRCMFGLPRPNIMRPLSHLQPYEVFLTQYRIHNGRTYDLLTFKEFCKRNSYDYDELIETQEKTAYMCALPVGHGTAIDAPSVEFQVRHQFIRSQTIERLINDLIQLVFVTSPDRGDTGSGIPYIDTLIDRILNGALLELGFGDPNLYTQDRVKFAAEIALALLAEMKHTTDVMSDINQLKKQLKMDVTEEELKTMRDASGAFMEDLAPIAALLALNQLSLEGIFKQEPEFEHFVDGIIREAEEKTNEAVPLAAYVVETAAAEAKVRVMTQTEFPYRSFEEIREASEFCSEIVEQLVTDVVISKTPPNSAKPKVSIESGDHIVFPVEIIEDSTPMAQILEAKTAQTVTGQGQPSEDDNYSNLKDLKTLTAEGDGTTLTWTLPQRPSTAFGNTKFQKMAPTTTFSGPLLEVKGTRLFGSPKAQTGPAVKPRMPVRQQSLPQVRSRIQNVRSTTSSTSLNTDQAKAKRSLPKKNGVNPAKVIWKEVNKGPATAISDVKDPASDIATQEKKSEAEVGAEVTVAD